MDIVTVKISENGYLLNGGLSVPTAPGNAHFDAIQDWISEGNVPEPEFTSEELTAQALADAKIAREAAVAAIQVTTAAGNTFDGDELSQNRMGRAVAGLDPLGTIQWVLADNSAVIITREELKEALLLAGDAATTIWVNR